MNKNKVVKNIALGTITSIMIMNPLTNLVYANNNYENSLMDELNSTLYKIEQDTEKFGDAKDEDVKKLEGIISKIDSLGQKDMSVNGRANQWIDVGSGYRFRIDTPESNGNPNYHVHVYKNGKQVASQNVDGTKSHGSTLNDIGSSKIKKKIESNSKYKDAQKKQNKLKKGKTEVKKKYTKSQLKQQKYVTISRGIMISAMGFAIFSVMSSWFGFFAII